MSLKPTFPPVLLVFFRLLKSYRNIYELAKAAILPECRFDVQCYYSVNTRGSYILSSASFASERHYREIVYHPFITIPCESNMLYLKVDGMPEGVNQRI